MASLAQRISDELLPRVRQPAQYIGGEHNQLVRPGDWERAEVRVVIGFPDAYTIGMSHLGCQILYWVCNHMPGVCCERTYAPWVDAERVMRERGIPLFTWDTRRPVIDADIFAISMQYELCFTTVLNMLDLAGIPVRHADRMREGGGTEGREQGTGNREQGEEGTEARRHGGGEGTEARRHGGTKGREQGTGNREQGRRAPASGRSPISDPRSPISDYPLIIVGGPQADNPEPMAEFVDLVVMGDGEHSLRAIVEAVREYKRAGVPRRDMIERIARRFPWVYAPNLYGVSYHEDGAIAGLMPKVAGLPAQIERCKTPDFDAVPFPTRPLVPWSEIVHDRIGIEIMRGCPQVCRFCHAGYTKRPLNLRTVERVLEIAEEAYWATGHDEISLLSLSTADYPYLAELAARLNERFGPRRVNLSFPSLRVDKMLKHIPWMGNQVRKGGITMAVEAARDDMRGAIRKKVTDGKLLDGVREIYKAGWNRVKLYFMAGFPGEREEDIRGIVEVAEAVSLERTKLGKPPAQVTASVGWLVPKPFTPLQWMAQPQAEYFEHVRDALRQIARQSGRGVRTIVEGQAGYGAAAEWASENYLKKGIGDRGSGIGVGDGDRRSEGRAQSAGLPDPGAPKTENRKPKTNARVTIRMHHPHRSILEGVMARGDRRLCAVIEAAWRRGARFDGWDECYDDAIWRAAYAETGVDPAWYAHRERPFDERLPWDHVGLRIGREYLVKSYDDVYARIGVRKPPPAVHQRRAPIPAGSSERVRSPALPVLTT